MDNRTVVDCSHNIDNRTAVGMVLVGMVVVGMVVVGMVVVGMVVDIVVDKHMIVVHRTHNHCKWYY